MSTHVLLGAPNLERVDKIEIEPQMVMAARVFESVIPRAFSDPRGHLQFEDARTFFSSQRTRYDLIFSEPSNPWVSGIATLFTREFYGRIDRGLNTGGLYVQWIYGYEISLPLVATIVTALGDSFEDYALYNLNERDLLFVAGKRGVGRLDPQAVLQMPDVAADLAKIGVLHAQDFDSRFLGTRSVLESLFASYRMPANSDYFPVFDLGAVRARLLREDVSALFKLGRASLPILPMLEPQRAGVQGATLTPMPLFRQSVAANAVREFMRSIDDP